jgi:putative cardiolipin synthase
MISKKDSLVSTVNCSRAGQAMAPGANFLTHCLLVLVLGFSLTSCAALPEDYPRTSSTAFQDYLETSVGQLFEAAAVQHPDKSGFAIIRYGRQAFTARIALTALAEKSLDVQYYIWEEDTTGRILAERLIRAADRGVRVARCLQ